jgi:hypothetical protein
MEHDTSSLSESRRGPGRPKGLGRTPGSGRKPGTPNRTTAQLRELISVKGKPIEFLCKVADGQRIRVGPQGGPGKASFCYPSMEQRLEASKILAKKIVADLQSNEITGPGGTPLNPAVDYEALVDRTATKALALIDKVNEKHRARG